ncbi:hypothetical protein [Glacieibacterium sp.]
MSHGLTTRAARDRAVVPANQLYADFGITPQAVRDLPASQE